MAVTSCRVWGCVAVGPVHSFPRRRQQEGCNDVIIGGSVGNLLITRREERRLKGCSQNLRIASKTVAISKSELLWDDLRIQHSCLRRDKATLSKCRSWNQRVFPKCAFPTKFSLAEAGGDAAHNMKFNGFTAPSRGWAAPLSTVPLVVVPGAANAMTLGNEYTPNVTYGEVSAVLEAGVQLLYLGALLALLGVGSFLVVRQVLIRRELESAAKELQDRVRSGEATSEEYFELGAVMLRKKFFVLANRYLESAIKKWDGDEQDLAQVYNALGFSYFSDDKLEAAIGQYEKAVKLQPGYVTAWNNLGDAYEKKKDLQRALKAYEEALQFDPSNKIARQRRDVVKERVDRFQGIPSKSE